METKITFNVDKITKDIGLITSRAQKKLDAQVMKDSNFFCPMDTGTLKKSVLSSVLGSGRLVWSVDYAKKMYNFSGTVSKDSNPNASVKWFEVAKSRYKDRWTKLVDDEYKKG